MKRKKRTLPWLTKESDVLVLMGGAALGLGFLVYYAWRQQRVIKEVLPAQISWEAQ